MKIRLYLLPWVATISFAQSTVTAPVGVQEEVVQLSAFEVSTKQDEGYRSNNSASGNKTGTAIRETPQSIQIVNQSFIDDLQARSVADALVYTSGLTEGQNSRGDRFEIRGFTTGIPFKNGFRDSGRAPRDTANFDRIEVAKGPASVIFSRTSAGGAVNILTKLPQRRRLVEVTATLGANEYYRGTLDVTGPLTGDKLLYRGPSRRGHVLTLDRRRNLRGAYKSWPHGETLRYRTLLGEPWCRTRCAL